ncbi:MAG: 3-dehydroquinate synthase family protein [bacterium]
MSRICQITVDCPQVAPAWPAGKAFSWMGQSLHFAETSGGISGVKTQSTDDLRALSLEIFGRANVLSILMHAFSHGLTRDTVWNLDGISKSDLDCYLVAARVYKRGVATSGTPTDHKAESIQSIIQKNYAINFVDNIEECFASFAKNDLIIVDQSVSKVFAHKIPHQAVVLEFSEANKSIETLASLVSTLRVHHTSAGVQDCTVHVVGGGVAGDLVGMAAGLLGLKTHYVPTTLMAMVDSSVGGKVGVNFEPWGKNQIGLFHNPAAVSVYLEWLKTLPREEFKAGLAEALKHALLSGDLKIWATLLECAKTDVPNVSAETLAKVVQVKVDIVARDPLEMGERAILNFGHTLGHVIESIALKKGLRIPHGQCVAVGMLHALRLSKKYFGMQTDIFIEGILQSGILPSKESLVNIFGSDSDLDDHRDEFISLLLADKKSKSDNTIRFVLLKAPGQIARGSDGAWSVSFKPDDAWEDICQTFQFYLGT